MIRMSQVKAEQLTAEIGDLFAFADKIVFVTQLSNETSPITNSTTKRIDD